MAFEPYDITTDVGKVRFHLNDTIENVPLEKKFYGPFPDKRNFQDEEIQHLLTLSGSSINGAVIAGARTLQSAWSDHAVEEQDKNFRYRAEQAADKWAKLADDLSKKPLDQVGQDDYGIRDITRVDQWSQQA